MAKIFLRPSQVVEELRTKAAFFKAKFASFPTVKVLEATDLPNAEELADSDCSDSETIVLYVSSGLSTGSNKNPGAGITDFVNGISVGTFIGTRDEHSQYATELHVLIKEFVAISLSGWEWDEDYTPLYFSSEAALNVKGKAILVAIFNFEYETEISYEDLDDTFDLWESLEDFLLLKDTTEADNQQGDTATVLHEVVLDGPP
jgi:hypothetical protein